MFPIMQKHPEDGKKPDINCCFQDLRKQPSLLLSRANSGWCCQPYNPAFTFYPPPCNTSLSRKEKQLRKPSPLLLILSQMLSLPSYYL